MRHLAGCLTSCCNLLAWCFGAPLVHLIYLANPWLIHPARSTSVICVWCVPPTCLCCPPTITCRWAKLYKDYTRQASQGFRQKTLAKSFRQETLDPEEHRRWVPWYESCRGGPNVSLGFKERRAACPRVPLTPAGKERRQG